jgi:hypothetical protein
MKERGNKNKAPKKDASSERQSKRKRSAFNEKKSIMSSHLKKDAEKDEIRIENHNAPPGLPDDGSKKDYRDFV